MSAEMDDPFTTPQRTSVQDSNSQLIVLPTSSPSQIKRTLEAHLAEVNKRIETAGNLGRALLSQQQEYEARIKELDEAGDTVDPELKKKLQDLEKEYNEVGRESARAVLTNKIMGGGSGTSPYGAGNLIPSAAANLQAQGTNSPSKLTVPSRRQRNQPSRQHDLEFAAELGQGLLVEVRRLQALLSEREEALRVLQIEKAALEQQAEHLENRVRSFDESEQRYKEENWDLELRNQDLLAQAREQQEIEDRLHAEIQRLCHEKEDIIKELDEWKHQNEKLFEDLEAEHKHHEVEFATMRRNLATNENERIALEKKVEDLKQELEDSHNQSSRLRASLEHREDNEQNEDPFVMEPAQTTPENSPPASPTKPTPRNTHLEAETLKSSLQHAHRMITNLKSNMNREKTEKAELRRLLQEARDDLENSRMRRDSVGGPPSSADKRRKGKGSFIKSGAPRPIFNTTLLGGARRTKDEVIVKNTQVDEEWEEAPEDEPSPTRSKFPSNSIVLRDYTLSPPSGGEADESGFETANEAAGMTTDAFETANEHDSTATETEAYRTGNESPVYDHPTSADELTETESGAHLQVIKKKTSRASSFGGSRRPGLNRIRHRDSVASSASTEEDSDGAYEDRRNRRDDFMTPVSSSGQRLRSNMGRPHSRGTRMSSQSSTFRNRERAFSTGSSNRDRAFSAGSSDAGTFQFRNGSPSSVRHRPAGAGERKSLFAELGDGMFNGGDDDEDTAEEDDAPTTPTRTSMPYVTKGTMVDCGIMTDDLLDYPVLDRSRNFLGVNDTDRPRTAFSTISSMHTIEERETTNDIGIQSEDAEVIEIGTQSDTTPVSEVGIQSEATPVTTIGTQFDPTPVVEMSTQSDVPYPTHPDLSKELQETEEELKATSAKLLVVEGAAAAAAAKLLEADEASKLAAAKLLESDEAGKVAAEKLIKADEEAKLAAEKLLQFEESEKVAAAKLLAVEEEARETAARLAASEQEAMDTAHRLAASEELSRATAARLAASEREAAAAEKKLAVSEEDGRMSAAKLVAAAAAGAIAAEALRAAQDSGKATEDKLRQAEEEARLAAERLAKEEANSRSIAERLAQEEENVRATAAKLAQEEENMRATSAKLAQEEENSRAVAAKLAQEEENMRVTSAKLAQEEENMRVTAAKLAQEEENVRSTAAKFAQEEENSRAVVAKLAESEEAGQATAEKLRLSEEEMKATAAKLAESEEEARATAESLAASQEEVKATAESLAASQEEVKATAESLAASQEEVKATAERLAASQEDSRATAERLAASQEEARATAERLAAAEEESRATAERLAESEEEVRTTAERLAASEAEMRATAERLSAAEEEARTTAERLAASKEEARITAERLAASEEEVKATAAKLAASEEETRVTAARLAESEEESRAVAAKLAEAEEGGKVSAAKLIAAAAAGALTADRLRAAQDYGRETERKLREAEEDARKAKELAQKNEQDFTKATGEVNTLKPIIVKLEEEIASLKAERDGFKETASALPAAQDLAQKNEASFVKAQEEINTLKPIISTLEEQLKNVKVERDNLQETELPAAKAMAQKNEANFVRAQEEINTLKPTIVKLEEEIVVLKVERQTLQETASTIPAAKEMAKKNEENYAKALREVNTLKPIIAELEEEVKILKEERDDLQENALPAAKEMAQKNLEEVNTLKPIIVKLEGDIVALKVERDDLQENALPAAQQLAQKKEAEINTLKPIIAKLEEDLKNLKVERDGFQETASALPAAQELAQKKEAEINALKPIIAKLEEDLKNLKVERDDYQVTASALPAAQELAQKKEDEINTLQPIIAKLKEDVETLKVERDSFQVTASALPAAKELAEKKETEINTLKPIIAQLEQEVKTLKPIIVNLEEELSTVKVERDDLKENALPTAKELAQKNEANFVKALEEVNMLKPVIIKLEEEVKTLTVERDELQGTALPAAQQMAQKNLEEVNTLKPIVARLEEEVGALKVERDNFQEIASALPAAKEMAQEKEAEVKSLKPIIAQLEQEIVTLKPVIVKLEEEVKSLTEERDDLQENALPAMKQIAEKSEADFVKTLAEVNTLKPIIVKLEEELVNVKQERDGLQEALPVAKEMAQKNEAEVNSLKPIIVKLEQEVKTLTVERDDLKETVPVVKEMAQKNQDNFAMALEEVNTLKPIVARLEEELATVQQERDSLKETLPVAQQLAEKNEADFVKARGEVDTLKPIIAQLEEEVGTLKPVIERLEEEVIILKAERDDLQDTALPAAQQMAQMNLEEVNTLKPVVVKLEKEVGTLKPVIVKLEEEIVALKEERDVLQETVSAIPVLDMRDTGVQPDPEPVSFAGTQTEPEAEEYSVVFDKVAEFEPVPEVPLEFSEISVQDTTPIEPVEKPVLPIPVTIPTPTARDASVSSDEETPKKVSETVEEQQQRPTTPSPQKASSIFGSMFGGWKRPGTPAQEPEGLKGANERTFSAGTFGTGMKDIPIIKAPAVDQEAQTDITHEFFDNMAVAKTVDKGKRPAFAVNSPDSMYLEGDRSRARSPSLRSHESRDSFGVNGMRGGVMKRPGSSGSLRGAVGSMGPPPLPSSSRNNVSFRPKTPVNTDTIKAIGPETPNSKAGTTPRPTATPRFSATRSEVSSPTSRRSSISSFASELDTRFNIMPEAVAGEAQTDPRMIQAITQTMIGEYLWKYTRNAGRGSLSHSRHKRFFWVHPYTRTLYWSERDPTTAGRAELRAKSVAIEAVRVVTDDNPMPPGLHRKSLVVITPGRSLKFTAPTGQRHETWFNALSYLLLRTGGELGEEGTGEPVHNPEDGQFNPAFNNGNGNGAPGSIRGGAAESLSSYNTRTTRASSPARNNSSLSNSRPSDKVARQGSRSRLSNLFRPTSGFGTFSTRSSKHNPSIYDQSELNDSAEDLREQVENEDSEKLENVRACCDGKHDVGTLPRRGGRKTPSLLGRGSDPHHHHHTDAASERNHSHA